MKYWLIPLQLLIVDPANAHCYSIWKYSKPQHCSTILEDRSHVWYVEITKLPPSWEDERVQAIDKLKEQIK